jgi:hypothetical protein
MKYACLIYDDEALWARMSPEESGAYLAEYNSFSENLAASGQLLGGEALEPTSTATTVRVRNGKVTTTDGPFAETKEQFGGFYLVEARDLNEAIQIASKIPSARIGTVEVRPVMDFSKQ